MRILQFILLFFHTLETYPKKNILFIAVDDLKPSIGIYGDSFAKTPNIEYDQHPLVGVTDIFNWGFRGINFHWDKIRNYTWQEIPGQLHIVRQSEIQTMLDIPYAYYLTK